MSKRDCSIKLFFTEPKLLNGSVYCKKRKDKKDKFMQQSLCRLYECETLSQVTLYNLRDKVEIMQQPSAQVFLKHIEITEITVICTSYTARAAQLPFNSSQSHNN